jgi:Tfp pilus assembly protein PilN
MIEINLLPKRRQLRLPTFMGLDLKKINVKWFLLALIILYLPSYVTDPIYLAGIKKAKLALKETKSRIGTLNQDLGTHSMLKKQLEDFNGQVKKLQMREKIVAEVLKEKINPFKPLLFLVKNIPDDMWWSVLNLVGSKVKIDGGSLSYKSIGDFILSANDSIYFGGSFILKDSNTKNTQKNKKGSKASSKNRRIERYSLHAKIKRFE